MNTILGIVIIGVCLFIEAFFAGSEIGIISSNRIRLSSLADKDDKRAKLVLKFLNNPEKFLSTTLVGVNLSVIVASSVATAIASQYIDTRGLDAIVATFVLFPFVLIFGEMIPKIVYQQHPDTLSLRSAYPLKFASSILWPFVFIATHISNGVSRLFSKKGAKKNPYVTREEIRLLMLESAKKGILDKEEIDMTSEIFDLGSTSVQSVMVPLANLISISYDATTRDAMELICNSGYSRIPVYRDREDKIIGTIEMSDLVMEDIEMRPLRELILAPYRVKADKSIGDILKDFQHNEENVAIVVDAEGKAIGIATLEDVVEEVIGEIEDEYDLKDEPETAQ